MSKTFECEICNGVNHVSRLTCKHCGTIPKQYSILRKPSRQYAGYTGESYIAVYVAFGAERQASHRTIKRQIRTVPLDYYATE